MKNPIEPFLKEQYALIVDGGLATELEARGFDLSDELWSARLLHDAPDALKAVHFDYLAAGADCIISASYQATTLAFTSKGFDHAEAEALLKRSVQLAKEARDAFWAQHENRVHRLRPLVAASVGPYGAFLADGSEYSGNYGLAEDALLDFHQKRWHLLAGCGPDLMACETIPSALEARALARLVEQTPEMPAWISFSCRDDKHISDGTPLVDVVALLDEVAQVVALGINCTAPRYIPGLVKEARKVTRKPIVVYPNSGEHYNVHEKRWSGLSEPVDFAQQGCAWRDSGASLIGGCCRTGPRHIAQIRKALLPALPTMPTEL